MAAGLSVGRALFCRPGIVAIIHHRIAHRLYRLGVLLLARIVAELTRPCAGCVRRALVAPWCALVAMAG